MDQPEGKCICPFSTMGLIIWLWGIRGVGHFRLIITLTDRKTET